MDGNDLADYSAREFNFVGDERAQKHRDRFLQTTRPRACTSQGYSFVAKSMIERMATPLRPFGEPRTAFVNPSGCGDIEMDPRRIVDELLDEPGTDGGTATFS